VNFAMRSMDYPERGIDEVRRFLGNGMEKLIERAIPNGSSHDRKMLTLKIFKEHYAGHCENHTAPYDGMVELLDRLLSYGIRIAVVSNKVDFAVRALCEKYFGDRIEFALGEREGIRRKPFSDSVLEVAEKMGISLADAVYVGDSEVDIETAKNAHMDIVSVTWGFRDKEELSCAGATVFADSAEDLEALILGGETAEK